MSLEKPDNIYCKLTVDNAEVISVNISRQRAQREEALPAVKRRQLGRGCRCRGPE